MLELKVGVALEVADNLLSQFGDTETELQRKAKDCFDRFTIALCEAFKVSPVETILTDNEIRNRPLPAKAGIAFERYQRECLELSQKLSQHCS